MNMGAQGKNSEEEVWLPILNAWGLPIRKSYIQLQMADSRPRSTALTTRCEGMMESKDEL
jgi:hypothetical protein